MKEVYRLINEHRDTLIAAIDRISDVRSYLELRLRLLSSQSAATDAAFQRAYRVYWRMNVARLDDAFYDRYFAILERCNEGGHADVRQVVLELASATAGKKSLQFSFATKLAHMVEPELPVYDSFVAAFYFYEPPPSDKPLDVRLEHLMTFYDFLRGEYRRVIEHRLLRPAVQAFRTHFDLPSVVGDERIIDWLLWVWVSELRSGAQQRGQVLYE